MAYTSIIPVRRLDNSITYIRNKDKTTKKGQSAGSLEEAIDYAMNRDKTERSIFEDAIGCVCETAYQDMVATKKRYHKMDGVQGFHLVQSFAKGEVTPELAHQIGMELAERLLQGKYEAVITTHLNTEHYHNHIVFNSVSMEDKLSQQDIENLQIVAAYLSDHYAFDIPLERLTQIACMRTTKLKSCFKKYYDCTITEYVQQRRMSQAEYLLAYTELTVGQVAQTVGYSTSSRFAELFRKSTGLLPLEYKKNAQRK